MKTEKTEISPNVRIHVSIIVLCTSPFHSYQTIFASTNNVDSTRLLFAQLNLAQLNRQTFEVNTSNSKPLSKYLMVRPRFLSTAFIK